jgi:hypothetical protein
VESFFFNCYTFSFKEVNWNCVCVHRMWRKERLGKCCLLQEYKYPIFYNSANVGDQTHDLLNTGAMITRSLKWPFNSGDNCWNRTQDTLNTITTKSPDQELRPICHWPLESANGNDWVGNPQPIVRAWRGILHDDAITQQMKETRAGLQVNFSLV